MPKNEPITPGSKDEDEEFFKEHGIEDDEVKELFRTRYAYDEYKAHKDSKKAPAPEKKEKRKFGLLA